jgi:hypothetical protein
VLNSRRLDANEATTESMTTQVQPARVRLLTVTITHVHDSNPTWSWDFVEKREKKERFAKKLALTCVHDDTSIFDQPS